MGREVTGLCTSSVYREDVNNDSHRSISSKRPSALVCGTAQARFPRFSLTHNGRSARRLTARADPNQAVPDPTLALTNNAIPALPHRPPHAPAPPRRPALLPLSGRAWRHEAVTPTPSSPPIRTAGRAPSALRRCRPPPSAPPPGPARTSSV